MKIESHSTNQVLIIKPKGKITIGLGDVALRKAVGEALEAGARRLVINLHGVSSLDSSGVGELVSAYTTVTQRSGKLVLAELPSKIADILQITQLIQVFDVYDSEQEAVDSLS